MSLSTHNSNRCYQGRIEPPKAADAPLVLWNVCLAYDYELITMDGSEFHNNSASREITCIQ